jgi:hypothetical protein
MPGLREVNDERVSLRARCVPKDLGSEIIQPDHFVLANS